MKLNKFDVHIYEKLSGKSILCKRNCTGLMIDVSSMKFIDEEGNIIVFPSYKLEKRYVEIR